MQGPSKKGVQSCHYDALHRWVTERTLFLLRRRPLGYLKRKFEYCLTHLQHDCVPAEFGARKWLKAAEKNSRLATFG